MTLKRNILTLLVTIITVTVGTVATAQSSKSVGKATYYGNKFHGRRTSDGSRYHRDSLTCAHKTLPFGTLLKVRNPKNDQEVVVKVTDRGPFRPGAIVDLSFAAAKQIGIVSAGVASVEVTQVGSVPSSVERSSKSVLPELQLIDPSTGEYYTAAEWAQRDRQQREIAQAEAAAKRRQASMAKAKQEPPRFKVMNDRMTAKGFVPKMPAKAVSVQTK